MILVTAVVKPFRLSDVLDTLTRHGVTGVTVTEARGYGRQGGHTEVYRGSEFSVGFVSKIKIEILVADGEADELLEAIMHGARTGNIGDGKIWTTPVGETLRVRTGERNESAL